MENLKPLQDAFLEHLQRRVTHREPQGLYDPVHYILALGGKRLRPLLTLLSTSLYGCRIDKAMDAALAVEVFHNFTLLHDDIMDAADLRRGQPTVHKKWNENTGILSGDAMLILSYQYLESYEPEIAIKLYKLFTKTALEVCEGQQHDVDFETRDNVTIEEYLNMIRLKTSVLVGCALKMGAIIAGADDNEQQKIYDYGIALGMAFQLMDDYLDAYGDPETFGKEVGGDIRENKKTYLYLKSTESTSHHAEISQYFSQHHEQMTDAEIADKKTAVKILFTESGGAQATQDAIAAYTQDALNIIETLNIDRTGKDGLIGFSNKLMNRVV